MRINHNAAAMNTQSRLASAQGAQAKSLEKLSSGLRINRAGDDAAGLAISEKMRGQIGGLNQASRNAQDGISLIQTAEGALSETHSMLQRTRELTVQANNGTNTSADLGEIQKEISQLNEEITRIADKTQFNAKTLLTGDLGVKADATSTNAWALQGVSIEINGLNDASTVTFAKNATAGSESLTATFNGVSQEISLGGDTVAAGTKLDFDAIGVKLSFGGNVAIAAVPTDNIVTAGNDIKFQIGANENTTLNIGINDMRAAALGTGIAGGPASLNTIDVSAPGFDFDKTIQVIDKSIEQVSSERSKLGAAQNRLDHTINNLTTTSENLSAAESRIRDVDMAKEMMEFTKNNILSQAGTAMLAQANQMPQGVLQLLG